MHRRVRASSWAAAVALAAGQAVPAQAQADAQSPAQANEAAAIREELARMRAQMERMADRIDQLEGQLAAAQVQAGEAGPPDETATRAASAAAPPPAAPAVKVTWKGAPQLEGEGGWSFKPRGRINLDAGMFDAPASTGREDGFASEVRRARLGFEGTIPGGLGYKFEAGFGSDLEIVDAFVTYADDELLITVGHQNTFQSLEEMSSSLHLPFMERAAFTDAFGFERRLGVSASYAAGDLLVQAGAFTDNFAALPNRNLSFDGRVVYAPELGGARLHLGGSLHRTELNGTDPTVRYRQRPYVHTTDERFVDTGAIAATGETGYGLEAALIAGGLDVSGEAFWQAISRPGLADPTFFGGYVQVGYFLTRGDRRGYKEGAFDRIRPARPFGKGGIGAVQLSARYDYLDLNDEGIVGGRQRSYQLALVWAQTDYTRLMVNYARLQYRDAVHPASGGERSYGVDAFGMRAQVDF